jgi:hypothetical protein
MKFLLGQQMMHFSIKKYNCRSSKTLNRTESLCLAGEEDHHEQLAFLWAWEFSERSVILIFAEYLNVLIRLRLYFQCGYSIYHYVHVQMTKCTDN